ncbi:hypothetical protein [Streptomyces sp. enrichment culture]|uniref:hypothetical protein n=1 Tax=Streptomyces sp. enrichment culture TaxID=1795815 RepID=UPI003F57391D
MGVFARLLRRSKATEETSTAEAPAAEPATGAEAAEADAASGTSKTAPEPAEAVAGAVTESSAKESGADADTVGIPKQQSAEEAADNEAGEGAHT